MSIEMNGELIRQLRDIAEKEKEWYIDSKKMLETGKLMQICPYTHNMYFSGKEENYIKAVYVCRGQITLSVNHQQVVLRQGELLFFNQYTRQETVSLQEEDLAVKFILLPVFFDMPFHGLGEENLLWNFLVGCLRKESSKSHYLHFKTADVLPVQNFVENMIWMALHCPNESAANQMTMSLLLMLLLKHTDRLETGEESFDQDLVIRVLRYIEDNYQDGKLNELCQVLGYDIYWMSRAIKRLTGKNYKELLQIKRLNHAGYLLLNTRAAVADISLAVGYDNTSYFHRIFRDYYGVSPKEYRKENLRGRGIDKK